MPKEKRFLLCLPSRLSQRVERALDGSGFFVTAASRRELVEVASKVKPNYLLITCANLDQEVVGGVKAVVVPHPEIWICTTDRTENVPGYALFLGDLVFELINGNGFNVLTRKISDIRA